MTPEINSFPPSRVTVYQAVHPSVNLSLPPSIHHIDRCQTAAVRGISSIHTPSLGRNKGWWQITQGSRRIHKHTHTHTNLQCADKAVSWICCEPHLHLSLQKNAYANEDNADRNQKAPSPPLHSLHFFSPSFHLFISRSLSVSLIATSAGMKVWLSIKRRHTVGEKIVSSLSHPSSTLCHSLFLISSRWKTDYSWFSPSFFRFLLTGKMWHMFAETPTSFHLIISMCVHVHVSSKFTGGAWDMPALQ